MSHRRSMAAAMKDPAGDNAYEKQRQERMQKNRERLVALEIPDLVADLAPVPKRPTKPRTSTKATRKRPGESSPKRRSARVAGLAADGNQIESGDLALEDIVDTETADAAYIRQLEATCSGAGTSKVAHGTGSPLKVSPLWPASCGLAAQDVVKVVPAGCVHLAFHPTTATTLLAAADKYGNLALWHCDSADSGSGHVASKVEAESSQTAEDTSGEVEDSQDSATSGAAFDGVIPLRYHRQYISGLRWAGGGEGCACLYTASYDGSLRRFDPGAGAADLVLSSDDHDFSAMDVTADGRTAVLGTTTGDALVVDCRARTPSGHSMDFHHRKINTVHFEPSREQVFVTSSTDASVRIWDLRRLSSKSKPVAEGSHRQGCQAAFFDPDGTHRVLSTSFDDTLVVWDGSGKGCLERRLTIPHNNATGRWVLPFRAVWAHSGSAILVGNMKRAVDVIDGNSGKLRTQLKSEDMTAIPSRMATHQTQPLLAAATASGRIHLYK